MKLIITALLMNLSFLNYSSAKVFILIGPSGVGKTTLIKKLGHTGLSFNSLITHTTREIRPGEKNGKDYFFLNLQEFIEKEQNGDFLTTSIIYKNMYGISKEFINKKLQENRHLICCLTGEVAHIIKNCLGDKVTTIFIAPPSFQELETRLLKRKTENESSLKTRLESAKLEILRQDSFDHKFINDDLNHTTNQLEKLFHKK